MNIEETIDKIADDILSDVLDRLTYEVDYYGVTHRILGRTALSEGDEYDDPLWWATQTNVAYLIMSKMMSKLYYPGNRPASSVADEQAVLQYYMCPCGEVTMSHDDMIGHIEDGPCEYSYEDIKVQVTTTEADEPDEEDTTE